MKLSKKEYEVLRTIYLLSFTYGEEVYNLCNFDSPQECIKTINDLIDKGLIKSELSINKKGLDYYQTYHITDMGKDLMYEKEI